MQKNRVILLAFTLIVVISTAAWAGVRNKSPETVDYDVAATIFPIHDIAQQIAGDAVHVGLILPAGASPHTFEVSPSDIRNFTSIDAVYAVGHNLDTWASNVNADADIVTLDKNIALASFNAEHTHGHEEEHEDHGGHDHKGINPHYWLTIPNAILIAETVANDLSARYPEHADTFASNLERYTKELQVTDDEIRTRLSDLSTRELITLHDAWYYFAEEYDLEVVATFEPSAGREPTPQYIESVLEELESHDLRVIYSEPQLATEPIRNFANDYGVNVAVIDPEGGIKDVDSYIELMLYNAKTIQENQ